MLLISQYLELPNSSFAAMVSNKKRVFKNYCGYFGFISLNDIVTCLFMKHLPKDWVLFVWFIVVRSTMKNRNIKQNKKGSSRLCSAVAGLHRKV